MEGYIQFETDAMKVPYILGSSLSGGCCYNHILKVAQNKRGKHFEGDTEKGKLIDFKVLKRPHLRKGVIAQFFYNGGQTAINSLFLVYCCVYVGMEESIATTFFGLYMLAFLLGRWIGTLLMAKFRPQDMLVLRCCECIVMWCDMIFGGMVGLYAMLAVSFFMSIINPTQFSLALQDLGENTKSSAFSDGDRAMPVFHN